MKHTIEYNWYNSYVDTDMLWLEDVLSWDDVFDLVTSEYNLFSIFTAAFFFNNHHFLDGLTKLSILDFFFIHTSEIDLQPKNFISSAAWDQALTFNNFLFSVPSLFYADFQDLLTITSYYSPELIVVVNDYLLSYWYGSALEVDPAASFDVFQDTTGITTSEFTEYLNSFYGFIIYAVSILTVSRVSTLSNAAEAYVTRAYFYLYSLSTEVRFQFEAALQVFFFVFLYTSMMIATFDDDQEELLEFFNTMFYYFFLSTFVYYLFKYSIHFFSFLEAAKGETKSTAPFSQFLFDALNAIALTLRFLVLMIRLNIYDTVDDILDSYYIFMADFDEEEYFPELLFSIFAAMPYDSDVNDDRSFMLEDEMDFASDFFSLYFIAWGKFTYFWLFILEEIARVSLALYVTYLLIFEINAVNRSYVEDIFFVKKRSNFVRRRNASKIS